MTSIERAAHGDIDISRSGSLAWRRVFALEACYGRRGIAFSGIECIELGKAGVDIVWRVAIACAPICLAIEKFINITVAPVANFFESIETTSDMRDTGLKRLQPINVVWS